jgi:hypothetical protein
MTIDSVLGKYAIDNLQLSIDLASAMKSFFDDTRAGENPVDVRKRIEIALRTGADRASKMDELEGRIKFATGLSVNERWYLDGIMDFLMARELQGQTIEAFATACSADPFNMPKFFKIAERPSLIKDCWGLAFQPKRDSYVRPEYQIHKTDETPAPYVPAPRRPVLSKPAG